MKLSVALPEMGKLHPVSARTHPGKSWITPSGNSSRGDPGSPVSENHRTSANPGSWSGGVPSQRKGNPRALSKPPVDLDEDVDVVLLSRVEAPS